MRERVKGDGVRPNNRALSDSYKGRPTLSDTQGEDRSLEKTSLSMKETVFRLSSSQGRYFERDLYGRVPFEEKGFRTTGDNGSDQ